MTNNYKFFKGVKEFGGEVFSQRIPYLFISPFIFPTASGEFIKTIKDYKNLSGAQRAGAITSLVVGGALGVISTIGAIYTAENFDLQGVIYPTSGIANLISGICEVKKRGKKDKEEISKLEQDLID